MKSSQFVKSNIYFYFIHTERKSLKNTKESTCRRDIEKYLCAIYLM